MSLHLHRRHTPPDHRALLVQSEQVRGVVRGWSQRCHRDRLAACADRRIRARQPAGIFQRENGSALRRSRASPVFPWPALGGAAACLPRRVRKSLGLVFYLALRRRRAMQPARRRYGTMPALSLHARTALCPDGRSLDAGEGRAQARVVVVAVVHLLSDASTMAAPAGSGLIDLPEQAEAARDARYVPPKGGRVQ
jgi:hypothetical protein